MRGEIIGIWSETWRGIWSKLAKHPNAPEDLFCELYRELIAAFADQPDAQALADIVDDPQQARKAFRQTKAVAFQGEFALVQFFERAHTVATDLGGDPLANRYFLLLERLLEKYSLRYDLRRPLSLNPTLPGVFAALFRELKEVTQSDAHLNGLMNEFEDAVRDLRQGATAGRIKSCLHKQYNLIEAMAGKCPGVTANTLGDMCGQLHSWPHPTIREAMKKLYGFRSDYPGVGHGGNIGGVLRELEMRDLVAVTVLLAGFSPYLTDQIDSDIVYRGS